MARFNVYALHQGGYVLDCQSDVLSGLTTRFVVPLMPPDEAPVAGARLNPSFDLSIGRVVMVTQFAGAMRAHELGQVVATLESFESEIMNALDMLLTGY